MVSAVVLINAARGQIEAVGEQIAAMPGVSEVFSVALLLVTLGGAGAWAIGSEYPSSPPERPIHQPTRTPMPAPIARRVTVRKGLRVNFDAVPCAVCFAVVLTA